MVTDRRGQGRAWNDIPFLRAARFYDTLCFKYPEPWRLRRELPRLQEPVRSFILPEQHKAEYVTCDILPFCAGNHW